MNMPTENPLESFSLRGKVALVTGAAQGIGTEIARVLHAAGARVAVADIQTEVGHEVADAMGVRAAFLELDVTDPGVGPMPSPRYVKSSARSPCW